MIGFLKQLLGVGDAGVEETSTHLSVCNHRQGDPDSVTYHEETEGWLSDNQWHFYAKEKRTCNDCEASITSRRTLGYVEIEDDELVLVD